MNEVSIKHNGVTFTAEYFVDGDTLSVYLPDGEIRTTELRGLNPESAAEPHLRSYAHKNLTTISGCPTGPWLRAHPK